MSDCRVPMKQYDRVPLPCKHCGHEPKLNKHKRCGGSLYSYMCANPYCQDSMITHWCDSEFEALGAWNLLNSA